MSDPRFGLAGFLLVALACGPGCARRVDPSAEPGGLFVNLVRADGIELAVEEDALVRAAARCADRWRRSTTCPVELVRADQPRRRDWARVVIGSAASAEARALAEALGLVGGGAAGESARSFHVFARDLSRPGDHLIACFEDPARHGLPVTLAFANEAAALEPTLEELWPGARPTLHVFRHGGLAIEAELTLEGTVRAATIVEHEPAWSEHSERFAEVGAREHALSALAEIAIPTERVKAYLARVGEARARAASWTEIEAGPLALVLSATLDDFAPPGRAGVAHELARAVTHPPGIEALLATGLPDDGGAGAAALVCVASLGEPAHEWMRQGAGVDAAGTWWGRELVEWCQGLSFLERTPVCDEIVSDGACERSSPHLVGPLRGLLFRALRETLDAERLRRVWTGEEELDERELTKLYQDHFPKVDVEARDRMITARTEHAKRALDPSRVWFGAHLVGAPELGPAAHGSRAALRAIDELSDLGAGTLAVESLAVTDHGPWNGSAWAPPRRLGAMEGDVGIASTLAAARERGLSTALFPALLTSPAGALAGDAVRTRRAESKAFFDAYESLVTHYALLAELCHVDLLAIGSGSEPATRVRPADGNAKTGMEEIYAANHEGWPRIVRRARQLYSGALTFSASSRAHAEAIDFWEMLDFTGIELFPAISARDRGPERVDEQLAGWLERQGAELAVNSPRPWIVTRIGFRSTERAAGGPLSGGGPADPALQERLYRGLARGLENMRAQGHAPRGLLLFSWPIDERDAGPLDRGFGARGKPAGAWLGTIFDAR